MLFAIFTFQTDIPTAMGVGIPDEVAMETDGGERPPATNKKYYIDSTMVYKPREGVDITTPIRDGQGMYM